MDTYKEACEASGTGTATPARVRTSCLVASILFVTSAMVAVGCYNTQVDNSDYALGPAPLHNQSPAREPNECTSYEDSLTGGQVFSMYCSYCHNAPSLAERPYSQFRNIAAHMRVRADLTGKEYAKLMEFLRRWNDVPPPSPPVDPSPKKFYFSQPMNELQEKASPAADGKPQSSLQNTNKLP
jgi:hypothetical protein